jgi:D-amino peptidase
MKFFISFDWEGVNGVTSWKQMEKGNLHNEAIENAISELKAVIDGILQSKVKVEEITICDSHSIGENIPFDSFPDMVNIIRGFPRKHYMVEGLNDTYNGLFLIGYHAPIGTKHSLMDHTYSSSSIYEVKVNDQTVGEAEINGLVAAEHNVPVLLISGDDKLFSFSSNYFQNLGTKFIITKESFGRFTAKMYNKNGVLKELSEKTKEQILDIDKVKPLKWQSPYTMELKLMDTLRADLIETMPLFKRIDGRSVTFTSDNFVEVYEAFISATLMLISANYI